MGRSQEARPFIQWRLVLVLLSFSTWTLFVFAISFAAGVSSAEERCVAQDPYNVPSNRSSTPSSPPLTNWTTTLWENQTTPAQDDAGYLPGSIEDEYLAQQASGSMSGATRRIVYVLVAFVLFCGGGVCTIKLLSVPVSHGIRLSRSGCYRRLDDMDSDSYSDSGLHPGLLSAMTPQDNVVVVAAEERAPVSTVALNLDSDAQKVLDDLDAEEAHSENTLVSGTSFQLRAVPATRDPA